MRTALKKFAASTLAATAIFAGTAQAQEQLSTIMLDDLNPFVTTTLFTQRFQDPKLENVACYVTRQRVSNGAINVPPPSRELSMSCAQSGPVNTDGLPKQRIIFEDKNMRLVGMFDAAKRTGVYVVHIKNLGDNANPTTATSAVFFTPN